MTYDSWCLCKLIPTWSKLFHPKTSPFTKLRVNPFQLDSTKLIQIHDIISKMESSRNNHLQNYNTIHYFSTVHKGCVYKTMIHFTTFSPFTKDMFT